MFTDMKKQLKDTQKEVSDYKQYVAEKYATADELRSALESVKELLLRLDDKIDDIRSQGRRHD
jgi:peptidoglycan hydrolase CwlO-like protein